MGQLLLKYAVAIVIVLFLGISVVVIESGKKTVESLPKFGGYATGPSTYDYVPGESFVTRDFSNPAPFINEILDVSLIVTNLKNDYSYALEEYIPICFELVDGGSANSSNINSTHTTLKWLSYSDQTPIPDHTITYKINSSCSAGNYNFRGIFIFETSSDNESITLGDISLTVQNIPNIPPNVYLELPQNNQVLLSKNVQFKCNSTDEGNMLNLTLWSSYTSIPVAINQAGSATTFLSIDTTRTLPNYGEYTYYCVACDQETCTSSEARPFSIINIPPVVGYRNPTSTGRVVTFYCNSTDGGDLQSLRLYANYNTGSYEIIHETTGSPTYLEISTTRTLPNYNLFNWYCEACDETNCITSPSPAGQYTPTNSPPSFFRTPPSGTISPTGNFTLNCTATDNDGVDLVAINDGVLSPAYQINSGTTTSKLLSNTYINILDGTYIWSCTANDIFGAEATSSEYAIIVDTNAGAAIDQSTTRILSKSVVGGSSVKLSAEIQTYNFVGERELSFRAPSWIGAADFIVVDNLGISGIPNIHNSTHLNYTFNSSKNYTLNFTVPPPQMEIGAEQAGQNYTKYFNVTTPNHFENVTGNLSINESYAYYTLFWNDGAAWKDVRQELKFRTDIPNKRAFFDELNTSNQELYIWGELVCNENWVIESEWGLCVNSQQTRIVTCPCEDDQCIGAKPAETQSCGGSSSSSGSGSGSSSGGGSGGGAGAPLIKTAVFSFDKNIYEIEVTYESYRTISITLQESSVQFNSPNFGVYEVSGNLDISRGKIRFQVPKKWLEENDLDKDKVLLKRHLADDLWSSLIPKPINENALMLFFEADFITFGVYAITALPLEKRDAETELPTNTTINESERYPLPISPSPEDALNLVIYIAIIVAMIGAIVAFFYISANRKIRNKEIQSEEKKINELKKFIEQSQNAGVGKEEIRKELVDAGWNREVINIYLK